MLQMLTKNWWILIVRGLFSIIFGLLALIWPGVTLEVLVLFFGAYSLIDGLVTLVSAFTERGERGPWWLLLLEGGLGIAAGIVAFVWPQVTAIALLYLIAAWAITTGVIKVIGAIQLRKEIAGEWLLALSGVLSMIFGILLAVWPASGALSLVWMIGLYAIVFGALFIVLGLRLNSWRQQVHSTSMP